MLNKRIVVLGAGKKCNNLWWNFEQSINKNLYKHAGVSGLTTATLLLQQEKAIKVHIVAKHFPGDLSDEYTSPWYI